MKKLLSPRELQLMVKIKAHSVREIEIHQTLVILDNEVNYCAVDRI